MSEKSKISLKDLQSRVEKLEEVVFGGKSKNSNNSKNENFEGATGGLRFLISKGFFDSKREFGEIREAMGKNGYHYSPQAIQTPLNRLSKAGGLLVAFKTGGKKVYAKRK